MNRRILVLAGLVSATAFLPAARCNDDDDDSGVVAGASYVQVERLARPAIVEALFPTHDFANAVNSIRPSDEPGALVGAVAAEAIAVLDGLDSIDGVDQLTAGAAIGALIPDVMRIDTTGASGYGAALNAVGSPARGRMITDDVMDITYSYLITGLTSAVPDGVPYYKPASGPGSTNVAIGHQNLHGQSVQGGTATFPFLANPN
jgi:hypothetical protein